MAYITYQSIMLLAETYPYLERTYQGCLPFSRHWVQFPNNPEEIQAAGNLGYYDHLFKGVTLQIAFIGCVTAIGGLMGGPIGAVIGFLAGTVVGYSMVKDYDSLIVVLQNMNDADKMRLVKEVESLIGSSMQDVLLAYVRSEANRRQLLGVFLKFY